MAAPVEEQQLDRLDRLRVQALEHENSSRSPLLRLPPEIRNIVYGYVFEDLRLYLGYYQQDYYQHEKREGSEYTIEPYYCIQDAASSISGANQVDIGRVKGLLSSCRLLYAEARPLVFSTYSAIDEEHGHCDESYHWKNFSAEELCWVDSVRIIDDGFCSKACLPCQTYFNQYFLPKIELIKTLRGLRYVIVEWRGVLRRKAEPVWDLFKEETAAKLRQELPNVDITLKET